METRFDWSFRVGYTAVTITVDKYPDAFLVYHISEDNGLMDIQRVYVSSAYTGHRREIAEELVHKALAIAKKQQKKVLPTDSYVREKFFPRHFDLYLEHCVQDPDWKYTKGFYTDIIP